MKNVFARLLTFVPALVFTFAVPKFDPSYTTVTIEITPADGGCDLTLTQEGVHPDWVDKVPEGWRMILDGLAREA